MQTLLDTEKDESKLAKMTSEERKLFRLRLKNMQKEVRAKADLMNGDPYDSLGFGMHAYRSTLFILFLTFSVISIIMAPVMFMYNNGPAGMEEYVNAGVPDELNSWASWSIANLGYSSMECKSIPLNQKFLSLQCPYGNMTLIADNGNAWGVTPPSSTVSNACLKSEDNENLVCD